MIRKKKKPARHKQPKQSGANGKRNTLGPKGIGRTRLAVVLTAAALVLGLGTGGVAALAMSQRLPWQGQPPVDNTTPASSQTTAPAGEGSAEPTQPQTTSIEYNALLLPEGELRAMWLSFLELRTLFEEIAEEEGEAEVLFTQKVTEMFANCEALGMNTVIVAVRPFSDAIYPSGYFPWSHVIHAEGVQGQDPGFDPLALLCTIAHQHGLRIEAWVNPYRVSHPANGPSALDERHPAAQNRGLVREVNGEEWYDPGEGEVEHMVLGGITEILQNYPVDGIHFDDYFYPSGIDESFDADTYAASGTSLGLADWRRENTTRLVQQVYTLVKAYRPTASFGVSMQGNNENNYTQMYADVKYWMANEGCVDYVMPQLYWGFAYRTQSGRESYAFANITEEWAFYPRVDSVRLYAGLGAYRIGRLDEDGVQVEFGDGGNNEQTEWESGHNLADMVEHLRTVDGFSGFALFRYEYLYTPGYELARQEREALAETL